MEKGDYKIWDLIEEFAIWQAARLWYGVHPDDVFVPFDIQSRVSAIERVLKQAQERGDLKNPDSWSSMVTRAALRNFAEKQQMRPLFLFPEDRGGGDKTAFLAEIGAEFRQIVQERAAGGQAPGLKQIGQGAAAEEPERKAETTGQAERVQTADAEDPEPGREPVFFRSKIAKTLGLSCLSKRAGETLRKTLEPDYGFPVHLDTKGNRWNYRDEIEDWKANHVAEIDVLNERKRKPKEQKKKK